MLLKCYFFQLFIMEWVYEVGAHFIFTSFLSAVFI